MALKRHDDGMVDDVLNLWANSAIFTSDCQKRFFLLATNDTSSLEVSCSFLIMTTKDLKGDYHRMSTVSGQCHKHVALLFLLLDGQGENEPWKRNMNNKI